MALIQMETQQQAIEALVVISLLYCIDDARMLLGLFLNLAIATLCGLKSCRTVEKMERFWENKSFENYR